MTTEGRVNHTPGPWAVFTGKLRPQYPTKIIEVQSRSGAVVPWSGFDQCNLPLAEKKANARLIAAAPDLLAALKDCVSSFESMQGEDNFLSCDRDALISARAALKKAGVENNG